MRSLCERWCGQGAEMVQLPAARCPLPAASALFRYVHAVGERWSGGVIAWAVRDDAGEGDGVTQDECTGSFLLSKPVFFVGFMGAGKTSVAQWLARECGLDVKDTDMYLEQQERRTVSDIFAEDGEDYFRACEARYLKKLAGESPCLISCGGGIVLRAENVRVMKECGYVVCLIISVETAAERILDAQSRPLFKNLDTARAIAAQRVPLYDRASDVQVETAERSVAEIAREVRDILLDRGILVRR